MILVFVFEGIGQSEGGLHLEVNPIFTENVTSFGVFFETPSFPSLFVVPEYFFRMIMGYFLVEEKIPSTQVFCTKYSEISYFFNWRIIDFFKRLYLQGIYL